MAKVTNWYDVLWNFRMLIRYGDFGESGFFEKASGKLDLPYNYGKLKISIEYKGPDTNYKNAVYKIEMNNYHLGKKSFEIKVSWKDLSEDDPFMQSRWIVEAAEDQMIKYFELAHSSVNGRLEESSGDLVKDILKGRFDPKIPQLLIYAESDFQGLEIFFVLEKITHGKGEWPEKNLELVYSYQISGKGINEEGKFVGIIEPEESKEDVVEDIAEFVMYIIK